MDPRDGLDNLKKRRNSCLCQGKNQDPLVFQAIASSIIIIIIIIIKSYLN
jgi:hypothetical protein